MKKLIICLTIVEALICWRCAVTDIDRTVDMKQYKTFAWGKSKLEIKSQAYKSELIESNIKTSIQQELVYKGLIYNAKKSDLLISYEVYTETKEHVYRGAGYYYYPYYYPFYDSRYYWYGGFWGAPMYWNSQPTYYSFTQGTLIINLRDRRTGKLVLRGLVQGDVDNIKALKKNISKGVKAILKKYPVVTPPLMPIPKGKVS